MNNLTKRIISSVVLLPIVIWIIITGGIAFNIMIGSAAIIMFYEWVGITKTSKKKILWWVFGLFYIGFPCGTLILISEGDGGTLILAIFLMVCAVDIGGYAAGKTIGGKKLAPKISPNKTWAGLFGGMLFSSIMLVVLMYIQLSGFHIISNVLVFVIVGGLVAIVAQIGDLFESWVKRKFNVKDSGNLIPGHGGLLDRLDGFLFVIITISIVLVLG